MGYIGTRINPNLHKTFTLAVIDNGKTKAQVLREFVKNYIEENKKRK